MNESEQNLPSLRGKCGGAGVLRRSWFPARNRFNKSDLKGLNRTSWHLWECAPAERWTEIICFQLTSTLRAWPPGHSFRLALSVVQTFAQPKGWMHIPTHLRATFKFFKNNWKSWAVPKLNCHRSTNRDVSWRIVLLLAGILPSRHLALYRESPIPWHLKIPTTQVLWAKQRWTSDVTKLLHDVNTFLAA
jgi:hypothetical protein